MEQWPDISPDVQRMTVMERHASNTEKNTRHIRNILGWLLFLVVVGIAGSLATGAYIASQIQTNPVTVSSCMSQGGSDPAC